MIYALTTKQDTSDSERKEIAQAIKDGNRGVIQRHVNARTIIHVMDAPDASASDLCCIFCRIAVFPTNARPPHGREALNNWHFEHKRTGHTPGKCIGYVRSPPIPDALGIENPRGHGCYICLDCETDDNNGEWCRQKYKTIVDKQTYCHLAEKHHCFMIFSPAG